MTPTWIVMPVLAGPEMTEAAIADCLAQSVPTRVLVVNQGVDDAFRARLERIAEAHEDRVFCWHHEPPLLSLAATWNRALDFVWSTGGTEALVVNNDTRLHPRTVIVLFGVLYATKALFVSAVGVTAEQFDPTLDTTTVVNLNDYIDGGGARGGPDFSCYMISKACHDKYRFDELIIPSHTEDLDYHRRMMLGGDGRKIFSVNLPYYHIAAGTLKNLSPEKRQALERRIDGARAYYARKWGPGGVNHETFFSPFDQGVEGISTAGMPNPPTTPALQAWVQKTPTQKLMDLAEDVPVSERPPL